MQYHRYSEIWPLLSGEPFEKLKADIKANGQRYKILLYQGQVLDGRNRLRACEALGIEPLTDNASVDSDEAALKLVISLNEHRRHLSVAQSAFAAERLANIILGHNRHEKKVDISGGISTSATVSIKTASKMLGTSSGSVFRARVIRQNGTPEQIAAAMSGQVSLATMAEKVRPVKNPRNAKSKSRLRSVPTARAPTPTPAIKPYIRSRLEDVLPTPEQVDPEFTGTRLEFVDKYGHVQALTAEQRAKSRFEAWVLNFKAMHREAKRAPDWPEVDRHWLRNVGAYDVDKLTEALEFLRPKIAEAEALLACAVGAVKRKQA